MGGITIKHGMYKSGVYRSFIHAKGRCNNENNTAYKYYGGRGIKFLFNSFEEFYKELGDRPEGLTIDRIDTEKHYESGNVKWSSRREQVINRRNFAKLVRKGNGYSWDKDRQKWDARICFQHKKYYLGLFSEEVKAREAYENKLKELTAQYIKQ